MKIESVSQKADRAGQYYLKLSDGCVLRLYPQTVAEFHLYAGRELEARGGWRPSPGGRSGLCQNAGGADCLRLCRVSPDLERRLRRKGRRRPTPRLP